MNHDHDEPTRPIPRAARPGDDEPTQVVGTGGSHPGPGHEATPTAPLPTGTRTEALPTGTRTQALPTGTASAEPHRTSAFPTAAGTSGPTGGSAATDVADHRIPAAGQGAAEPMPTSAAPVATAGREAGPAGATSLGAPPAAVATADPTPPAVSRTLRVGTVVWGLIIAIIGAGLIAVAAGARFDLELVLIGLLALAGLALVAGSMAVSLRRRH